MSTERQMGLKPGASPRRAVGDLQLAPDSSVLLTRLFRRYARRYVRKHFHSLRIAKAAYPRFAQGSPVVLYINHASWWDPIVGLILQETCFGNRPAFAPMDAAALDKYRFFKRLGVFGVEQGSPKGAIQFVRAGLHILSQPDSVLWITPQGAFVDARQRPVRFQPGLGHLATKVEHAVFLPVAIEYTYWEERLPEILVRFGRATLITRLQRAENGRDGWTKYFEAELQHTQDTLAAQATRRDPSEFTDILRGRAGVGGVYDLWRRLRSWAAHKPFALEHGTK